MERNRLIYDVPAVSSPPFRITNMRVHPDANQQLTIKLTEDFIGLYLNLGSAFEYAGADVAPGIFLHNQCNFIYATAGEYIITLHAGLHHSLALQLPLPETQRWSKDIPPLVLFLKGLLPGKSKFLVKEHTHFSEKLKDEVDRLLYSIWKDEYLGTVDIAATSFNIFLKCLSEITNRSLLPRGHLGNSVDKIIADAAQFLTDNMSKNITVEDLANKFGIGRRNLQKGFQEYFGETVHEYILRYRMDHARILLADRTTTKVMKVTKRNLVIEIIVFLFVSLFLYAAGSKLAEYKTFVAQIGKSPLLSDFAPTLAWAVPVIEILVSLLLVIDRFKMIGMYAAFGLMFLFTLYISTILSISEQLPCSCGGILSMLGWKEHLIFNIAFTLLGIYGIVLTTERKKEINTNKSVSAV